jgi:hypothetical protein
MIGTVLGNAFLLALYFYIATPPAAHAYFDLGTGAYMFQLVFGVGAAFFLSFRQQVMRKLNWGKRKPTDNSVPEEQNGPEEGGESVT